MVMRKIAHAGRAYKVRRFFDIYGLLALMWIVPSVVSAQVAPQGTPVVANAAPKQAVKDGLGGSLRVRPDARTMTLSIPAPRGQITDRNGQPFAQTKVVWYPALKFPQFEKADKAFVVSWARKRLARANQVFLINWKVSDEALWQHYRHRRWMAMPYTRVIKSEHQASYKNKLMPGLILHPVYMRHYPESKLGAHMVGYVGSAGKLEKGPINYGDPIFERVEGRAGLEKIFNEVLTGKEGLLRQDFEADGTEALKKYERRPRPGGTVVTTLDMAWQKHAEKVLQKYCSKGAFVVIDIHSGEVLAMASRPGFDLNDFVPFISTEKYAELRDDPGTPLFARAYQGAYPPASTFKPVVAVTALTNQDVREKTLIDCPAKIKIGNHWFNNWSKSAEGPINVKRALARSNNPWFYKVGMKTGPTAFLSVARRLGFGSKTGLPLTGETQGLIPSHEWMQENHGRRLMDGDTANLAIGQGVMLASPLQVAQAMAGIANGGALPKLRLVRQIQDVTGRVLVSNQPERRNYLNLDPSAVNVVQEGMMQVVHAGYGTGKRGSLSYTVLCGKTGTAQWGPKSKEQRLAWFSGFFPLDNPRFAFAALYEGKPHETLSGGKKAAPMVRAFFEHFKKDIKKAIAPPPRAMVIEEEEEEEVIEIDDAPRAIPLDDEIQALDSSTDETPALGSSEAEEEAPPQALVVEEDEEPQVSEEVTPEPQPEPEPEVEEEDEGGFISSGDDARPLNTDELEDSDQ